MSKIIIKGSAKYSNAGKGELDFSMDKVEGMTLPRTRLKLTAWEPEMMRMLLEEISKDQRPCNVTIVFDY